MDDDHHGDEDHGDDDHGDEDHGDDDHGDDDHGHGHGNLIHANYMFKKTLSLMVMKLKLEERLSLGSGELTISYGRDVVNAQFC